MARRRLVMAAQEIHSQRRFLAELRNVNGEPSDFKWLDSRPRDAKIYMEDFPGEVCYAANEHQRWSVVALDGDGNQVPATKTEALVQLKERQPFRLSDCNFFRLRRRMAGTSLRV